MQRYIIEIPENNPESKVLLNYLMSTKLIEISQPIKTEQDLLKEFYNKKLEMSEQALANGEVVEHNELKKEVEQWKSQRN
ncbi:MAG: hypothetical protein K8R54_07275 [Bacteroidales bacterium]|nr:hypothetical protein [Bacteroidales bacterium]